MSSLSRRDIERRNTRGATSRVSAFLFALLLVSSLILPSFVSAQTAAYAEIGVPDTAAFPTISTVLDVYDSGGQFISGLKSADVTMLENGSPRVVKQLTEFPVGAQIVVGLNPGPSFDVRDGQGVTRYEKLQQALGIWSQSLPVDTSDNLSLVTIAGPIIAQTDPAMWLASFAALRPSFRATTPNIQSLALTIDAANRPTPDVGMKRAVLFLTPHMETADLETALSNIGQRAIEGRVRIFIWFVDSELFFDHPSAALFQALATQTGGSFSAFDDMENLPDPETYFAPLRSAYRVTYESGITTSGDHTLSAEVDLSGTSVTSAAQTFPLNVQPPNPILSAPPSQITRQPPADDPYNEEILLPTGQELNVIFDFPDSHPRPITRVVLYVDGLPVAENTTGTLDEFTWDISSYVTSGPHTLRVEATDSLGLTGTSLETPVDVMVVRPVLTPAILLARYRYVLVSIVVGLAGLILLGILLSGRLRIRSPRARRAARKHYTDPVTQPVAIAATEPPTGPTKTVRRTRPVKIPDAPACLIRLTPDGQPASSTPIAILGPETKIGNSPTQADVVLDEAILSDLHARIQQGQAGYVIYDLSSVAGTWVNYEQVTREGHPLKHGDRVHLGHLMYRFELKNPPSITEPTITPADP